MVLPDERVREVAGLPPGREVVVVDYDIEDADKSELTGNPLDGELAKVTRF